MVKPWDEDMRPAILADAFDNPAIAAEMAQVVGVRYVCATMGCDWWGYKIEPVRCPQCGAEPIDRWESHAKACLE